MTEQLHIVSHDQCRGDGICADVCPEDVIEIIDRVAATVADRREECILCGHCVAVCPNDALSMPELPGRDFQPLQEQTFGYDDFLGFLQRRRSVRVFRDRPVTEEVIEHILTAAATAPMGMPPHSTGVCVVTDPGQRAMLLQEIVREWATLQKAFSNPVGRMMVRLSAGAEEYRVLRDVVIDLTRFANAKYERDGTDRYTYNAPVLMLFHGDRRAMAYMENAHLVCHHAMLAALSFGLGSTVIGLVPPIVDRSKTLRERLGIPQEHKVITSLVMGYPRHHFRKSIRRELSRVERA